MRGDILDWDKTNWIFDIGKISEMEVKYTLKIDLILVFHFTNF